MPSVKVLSLMQPWAQLVVTPDPLNTARALKEIETRPWKTEYRGEVFIHASDTLHRGIRLVMSNQHFRDLVQEPLTRGAIIGKVKLIKIRPTSLIKEVLSERERAFGDYTDGRNGWFFSNPVLFEKPIPAKGALSLWTFELPSEFAHYASASAKATADKPPIHSHYHEQAEMQHRNQRLK